MTQISDYFIKIKSFCDIYLEYDVNNERYKFNNEFADEINCELFKNDVNQFHNELIDVLENLDDKSSYIKKVVEILDKNLLWYEKEEINNFNSFHKLTHNSIKIEDSNSVFKNLINLLKYRLLGFKLQKRNYLHDNYIPSIVKTNENNTEKSIYKSLDSFLNLPEKLNDFEDDLFYHIIAHKSKTNNYQDKKDFEKVKLHYVLTKYFESVYIFKNNLVNLSKDISIYGIKDFRSQSNIQITNNLRCVVNLSKFETAVMFQALYKSKIFTFNLENQTQNLKAKCNFIDNNFSYINRAKKIVEVKDINKEFSYLAYHKDQEEITMVIDNIIERLNNIKDKLK